MAKTTSRRNFPKIDELQTLGWVIDESFDPSTLGSVSALRIPAVWVEQLLALGEADKTPPVVGLYSVLRATVPDMFYAFPNSFAWNPEKRPEYWLLSFTDGRIAIDQLWGVIRIWMRQNYPLEVVRTVAAVMEPAVAQMQWEQLDLNTLAPVLFQAILPHLVARWLVRNNFQLGLSDRCGSTQYWSLAVALAPKMSDTAATLVTHPAIEHSYQESVSRYSYYLRLEVAPPEGKTPMLLLLKAGVRRYITRSLKSGKLPKGKRATVYLPVQNLPWLAEIERITLERETTLVPLSIVRHEQLAWQGRIEQVLTSLSSTLVLPSPDELLSDPNNHHTQLLITYQTRFGTYGVQAGLEAADRYEVYERLSKALPSGLIKAPTIQKIDVSRRKKRSLELISHASTDEILGTYRIQLATTLPSVFSKLLEILLTEQVKGALQQIDDNTFIFTNRLGQRYRLELNISPLPSSHTAPLNLGGRLTGSAISAATQQRASQIVRDLRQSELPVNTHQGLMIEMLDYREFRGVQRFQDPKSATRWGYACSGWASQFITPLRFDGIVPNFKDLGAAERSRCENALLDLLRQLSFPIGVPFYSGFSGTALPSLIDIYGIYILRLNARRAGEQATVLPIVIRVPSDQNCCALEVCLPSEAGPQWMSFYEALLALSNLNTGLPDYEADQIQTFLKCVFCDLDFNAPTLLLMSDRNLRKDCPQLTAIPSTEPKAANNPWRLGEILPIRQLENVRVARLRSSNEGLVGDVCPRTGFNRYSGIYHNPNFSDAYFSIGRSPQSAKRPIAYRQRDRLMKPGWNQSVLEIQWLLLQPEDSEIEWTLIVHRLRESSPFLNNDIVTAIPQPLYAGKQLRDYLSRIVFEDEVEELDELEMEEEEVEFEQLRLF